MFFQYMYIYVSTYIETFSLNIYFIKEELFFSWLQIGGKGYLMFIVLCKKNNSLSFNSI